MNRLIILITTIIALKACPDSDERCASCQSTTCDFCYDSYISSTGKCTDVLTKVENCLTYANDGKTCKQCVFNFSLKNNECVALENCLRVDSDDKCISCANGAALENGLCSADKKCSLENCKHCGFDNGKEICIFCNSGYAIFPTDEKNQCKSTGLGGCLSLNFYDDQQCSLCKVNFYFDNGNCTATDVYQMNMESDFIIQLFSFFFLFCFF